MRALMQFDVVADDEYHYIEIYEDEHNAGYNDWWRVRFIRNLLKNGIILNKIKVLEYVRGK